MVNEHQCYERTFGLWQPIPADSKVKFAAWPTSWWPPGADQLHSEDLSELSNMAPHCKYRPGNIIIIF